jgi:hypothetical protein
MDFTRTIVEDSQVMASGQTEDADPGSTAPSRCSKRQLGELLALNEEMIVQLHLERLGDAGTAGFLTNMIAQHEKAAALLRAQLASAGSGARR